MVGFQRCLLLAVAVGAVAACSARPRSSSEALPPGLTCPVTTRVVYDHVPPRTIIGPSAENPLICLVKAPGGTTQQLILNWYAVDRLRSNDVDGAVEILTSLLTGPVGFKTTWTRFLGGYNAPYDTEFTVMPDQSITVGGKTYGVRVIKGWNWSHEDGETWIDKDSLTILKYVDGIAPSKSYTATRVIKLPAS